MYYTYISSYVITLPMCSRNWRLSVHPPVFFFLFVPPTVELLTYSSYQVLPLWRHIPYFSMDLCKRNYTPNWLVRGSCRACICRFLHPSTCVSLCLPAPSLVFVSIYQYLHPLVISAIRLYDYIFAYDNSLFWIRLEEEHLFRYTFMCISKSVQSMLIVHFSKDNNKHQITSLLLQSKLL